MFGFLINLLILLVLIFVIGLVVDDVIVVFENVECYVKEGKLLFDVVIIGMCEIVIFVILMIIIFGVVYFLMVLMEGVIGLFFKEFVLIFVGVVFILGIVVLMFFLMMLSCVLKEYNEEYESCFVKCINGMLDKMILCYINMLCGVMVVCWVIVVFVVVIFGILLIFLGLFLSEVVLIEDCGFIVGIGSGLLNINLDYI